MPLAGQIGRDAPHGIGEGHADQVGDDVRERPSREPPSLASELLVFGRGHDARYSHPAEDKSTALAGAVGRLSRRRSGSRAASR